MKLVSWAGIPRIRPPRAGRPGAGAAGAVSGEAGAGAGGASWGDMIDGTIHTGRPNAIRGAGRPANRARRGHEAAAKQALADSFATTRLSHPPLASAPMSPIRPIRQLFLVAAALAVAACADNLAPEARI